MVMRLLRVGEDKFLFFAVVILGSSCGGRDGDRDRMESGGEEERIDRDGVALRSERGDEGAERAGAMSTGVSDVSIAGRKDARLSRLPWVGYRYDWEVQGRKEPPKCEEKKRRKEGNWISWVRV